MQGRLLIELRKERKQIREGIEEIERLLVIVLADIEKMGGDEVEQDLQRRLRIEERVAQVMEMRNVDRETAGGFIFGQMKKVEDRHGAYNLGRLGK
jgi:hypothetical protein